MMLFSLTNALAICQELINDIFWDILNEYIIVYLDNTLISLSKMFEDYVIKVKEVFG